MALRMTKLIASNQSALHLILYAYEWWGANSQSVTVNMEDTLCRWLYSYRYVYGYIILSDYTKQYNMGELVWIWKNAWLVLSRCLFLIENSFHLFDACFVAVMPPLSHSLSIFKWPLRVLFCHWGWQQNSCRSIWQKVTSLASEVRWLKCMSIANHTGSLAKIS